MSGCASFAAACSFRDKIEHGTGIEMAEVLPGVLARFDIDALLSLAAPRPALIVSAADDKYSHDAASIVRVASATYERAGARQALQHAHYQGGHALTGERFDRIAAWLNSAAFASASEQR